MNKGQRPSAKRKGSSARKRSSTARSRISRADMAALEQLDRLLELQRRREQLSWRCLFHQKRRRPIELQNWKLLETAVRVAVTIAVHYFVHVRDHQASRSVAQEGVTLYGEGCRSSGFAGRNICS